MKEKTRRVYIGTSGWNYNHWKGVLYPEDSPANRWFYYYKEHFDTVEINNSFYRLPTEHAFKNWQKQAPADFIYAVKASRYITHMKKLKDPRISLRKFLSRIKYLKRNLGPVLYQLPPWWRCDPFRLQHFLKQLPKDRIHVFEFRNDSWLTKDVFGLLEAHGASFCIHDMPYVSCPRIVTGKIAYIRFHGASAQYSGGYPHKTLRKWARWITDRAKKVDVYVYFNNDAEGHAVRDALRLKKMVSA